jgi:hypothetical protein
MPNPEIQNSSYLDFTKYRITNQTTVASAYNLPAGDVQALSGSDAADINVAIVLKRANDPAALLAANWGARQATLNPLIQNGTLWTTYGTDQAKFDTVRSGIEGEGLTVLDNANSDYVTSAASQTVWVQINTAQQFQDLFGTTLYQYTDPANSNNNFVFWNGNLSLPQSWDVKGLWVDTENAPPPSNFTPGVSVTLPQGPQSIGNDSSTPVPALPPQDIAALYNFPLAGSSIPTGAIGLIEPGIGSALPNDATQTFQQRLTQYLTSIGLIGTGTVSVQGIDGQEFSNNAKGERSLDVGIVAAVNPNSDIRLYNGSGYLGNADASTFTAIQSAVYEQGADHPAVISDSWGDLQSMSPDSPFYYAGLQLYVDAALSNLTMFNALGDGGSGNETGNGLTNLEYNITSPYAVLVGGTSISSFTSAQNDPTLVSSVVTPALAGNAAMIWQLVSGGLKSLPANAANLQDFVETVWNQYFVTGTTIGTNPSSPFYGGYLVNTTSSGGVDPTQPTPSYQIDYGLTPITADPLAQPGRGAPDVAADGGGNTDYLVPNGNMVGTTAGDGTSAASPLWASLAVQLNAIFNDQGLPNLGYMNDLLYIASVIAPASFNDVTMGSNTSSSLLPGTTYQTINSNYNGNVTVTPTGFGYSAGAGYDLVSGLGTPNGVLLARALTQIAHSQVSFASTSDVLDSNGSGGWTSGANQSLLFQTNSSAAVNVSLFTGSRTTSYASAASSAYAWTSQFAEQVLQPDFDPNLVIMFDKQSQGALTQASVASGNTVGVDINAGATNAAQATLSTSFGFADFSSGAGAVRVARPVMVAETAGGADNQNAVIRIRQDGQDSLSLEFYRVDDMDGKIGGLKPGDTGYAAAAAARAYSTISGSKEISGPGYGGYTQTELAGVNAGDLVAMTMFNNTHGNTYWEFSQANETLGGSSIAHVWNYGVNTIGWEDTYGGGDRDYNDLIVGVDFTSASGHGLLV